MAFNYPGAYSFYRPRPQPSGYACYPDAYESAGDSYANTLFAPPFTRRRPSPPPTTFLPRNVSQNDYIRALAEEQAARSALSEAIQREQAARVRRERAEAEARARAQEEARRKALESEYKRRVRPQTIYGYPFGYHGYPQEYYDDEEEDDAQDSASPFDAYFYPSKPTAVPTHGRAHSQVRPQAQVQPQRSPSQTRECPRVRQCSPMRSPNASSNKEKVRLICFLVLIIGAYVDFLQVSSSPKVEHISIPITSPGEPQPAPIRHASPVRKEEAAHPEATPEQNDAAAKIQAAYRSHAARVSALEQIDSIRARLEELRSNFTFPADLDFEEDPASYLASYPLGREPAKPVSQTEEDAMDVEDDSTEPPRPKLAYTARNAPVHGHEDALLKLLQALDTIESGGDHSVRENRRAVVREVEDELRKVDENVRLRWKTVLERLSAKQAEEQAVEEKEVEQGMVVEESVPEAMQEQEMAAEASEPVPSTSTSTTEEAMDVEPSSQFEATQAPSSDAIVTEPEDDETNSTMSASIESSVSETRFDPTSASEPIIEEVESSDSEAGESSTAPQPLSVSLPVHHGGPETQPDTNDSLHHSSIQHYDSDVPAVVVDPMPQSSESSEGDEVFSDAEEGPIEDVDADLVHVEVQSEPEHQSKRDSEKSNEDSEFVML